MLASLTACHAPQYVNPGSGPKLGNVVFNVNGAVRDLKYETGIDSVWTSFSVDDCGGVQVHAEWGVFWPKTFAAYNAVAGRSGMYRNATGDEYVIATTQRYSFDPDHEAIKEFTTIQISAADPVCARVWLEKTVMPLGSPLRAPR